MRYEIGYEGHIDSLDPDKLTGWARQIGTDDPIKISVLVNNVDKLVITANEEREDLKDRGAGSWGFTIPTSKLKLSKGDKVRVKSADGAFELQNSPAIYNSYNTPEPWVESDLYPEYREERIGGDFPIELADKYHEDGYLLLENVVDHELADKIIKDTTPLLSGENKGGRVQDAWVSLSSVRKLALNEQILKVLEFLYERAVVPFQTLNFEYGTQQPAHSDTMHFSCLPPRFMAGAWVALEDTTPENGPLTYYPGSHRLKEYRLSDIGILPNPATSTTKERLTGFVAKPTQVNAYGEYEKYVVRLMKAAGFKEEQLIIKKGDVLIWASNLIHGGSEIKTKGATRWSQVTHYYFEGCMYFTPFFSDEIAGHYALKEVTNIATGKVVPNTYNGMQLKVTDVGQNLFSVRL